MNLDLALVEQAQAVLHLIPEAIEEMRRPEGRK
jgi:hypothetical protein